MTWWKWYDEPLKAGLYLCCWGHLDDYRNNIYEVHRFDGEKWILPSARPYPLCWSEITHPQEEKMLRELHEMK
jgi:hypothetical protein